MLDTKRSSLPVLIDHGKGGFLYFLGDVDAVDSKLRFFPNCTCNLKN